MKFAEPRGIGQNRICLINHSDTMTPISRRNFLAGSSAFAVSPAFGAVPTSGEVDVVIVGAGAAGIAAARRIAQAGKRYALIEASDRIGGRCVTDTRTFGVPFDRGARALFGADLNPVAIAAKAGSEVYAAPRLTRLRLGRRFGREGEVEDFLSSTFRARRAILEAVRGRTDTSADKALPKDLPSDWRGAVEFALGPFSYGRDLAELSAADLARAAERDSIAYARKGTGALLASLGANLNIGLSTPATKIEWGRALEVETSRGKLRARAVIVTASAGVLTSDKIKFSPDLPRSYVDALNRLKPGSYDRIALELSGNPLGLGPDDLVIEKSNGPRTAAVTGNAGGSTLCYIDVAGKFGADLSRQGENAMIDFAIGWLADLYGNDIKNGVKRRAATRWNESPFALGAISAAAPGGAEARKTLIMPVRDRLFFAGDAVHETLAGTLGGAFESGTRAAESALRKMGALREEQAEEPMRRRRRS
jgi:monoamine oxidase